MKTLKEEINRPCGQIHRATNREGFKHGQQAIERMRAIQWQYGTLLALTTAVTSPINSRIWADLKKHNRRSQ